MRRIAFALLVLILAGIARAQCIAGRGFTGPIPLITNPGISTWPVVADLNADGFVDIVARQGLPQERGYSWLSTRYPPMKSLSYLVDPKTTDARHVGFYGIGSIEPYGDYAKCYSCVYDHDLVVADVNGDKLPDIVASLSHQDKVYVLLNDKAWKGHFKPPIELATGDDPAFVRVGDFDGDGIPDIVTLPIERRVVLSDNWRLSFHRGHGDGTFDGVVTQDLSTYASGDGSPQNAWGGPYNPSDGDKFCRALTGFDCGPRPWGSFDKATNEHRGFAFSVARFNGRDELLLTSESRNLEVFRWNGSKFVTRTSIPNLSGVFALTDWDGDGKLDLVGDGSNRIFFSFLDDALRTPAAKNDAFATRWGQGLTDGPLLFTRVADFDHDGKPDIFTARPSWYRERTLLPMIAFGDGTRTSPFDVDPADPKIVFPVTTIYDSTAWFRSGPPVVADLNHDDYEDILFPYTDGEHESMFVLLNLGLSATQAAKPMIELVNPASANWDVPRKVGGRGFANPVGVTVALWRIGSVVRTIPIPADHVIDDQHIVLDPPYELDADMTTYKLSVRNHCYTSNEVSVTVLGHPKPLPEPKIDDVQPAVLHSGGPLQVIGTNLDNVARVIILDGDTNTEIGDAKITAQSATRIDTDMPDWVAALCPTCRVRTPSSAKVRLVSPSTTDKGGAMREVNSLIARPVRDLNLRDPFPNPLPELTYTPPTAITISAAQCDDAWFYYNGYKTSWTACNWGVVDLEGTDADARAKSGGTIRRDITIKNVGLRNVEFAVTWDGFSKASFYDLAPGASRDFVPRGIDLKIAGRTGIIVNVVDAKFGAPVPQLAITYHRPDSGVLIAADTFKLSYYYVAYQTSAGTSSLYRKDCTAIAMNVTDPFLTEVAREGTGVLFDKRTINYDEVKDCGQPLKRAYVQLDGKVFPWGSGHNGTKKLIPYRSLAVDPEVPSGTVIYVPEFDGLDLPQTTDTRGYQAGGFRHDGCFVAVDAGGAIRGREFDVFTPNRESYLFLDSKFPTNTRINAYYGGPRCAHVIP